MTINVLPDHVMRTVFLSLTVAALVLVRADSGHVEA